MEHVNPGEILSSFEQLSSAPHIDSIDAVFDAVQAARSALGDEDAAVRPPARSGVPGSLVFLKEVAYTIIVPDLHARRDFFLRVLNYKPEGITSVLEDVISGEAMLVCVGDAFHSERRKIKRWQEAFAEYMDGYRVHDAMDAEMTDNLLLLQMICELKTLAGENFHFLKGNHENIRNERNEGNYPFMKFVREGEMVSRWMKDFAGEPLYDAIYWWEKSLPLMCAGRDFLVAHCEPGRALTLDEVINAYDQPDVIQNLTWVGNGEARPGSVRETLRNILGKAGGALMFGGHRPVQGRYDLRQNGSYVQINTPDNHVVAIIRQISDFDPERDIIDLEIAENNSKPGAKDGEIA